MTDHLNHSGYPRRKIQRPRRLDAQGPGRIRPELCEPKRQQERAPISRSQHGSRVPQLLVVALLGFRQLQPAHQYRHRRSQFHQVPRLLQSVPQRNQYVFERHLRRHEYNQRGTEHLKRAHQNSGSTEFTTHLVPRNTLSGSFFFKDDTHKEDGIYPGRAPFPLLLPNLVDEDQQASIGLQDVIAITQRLRITAGFNADHFNGVSYNTALYRAGSRAPVSLRPRTPLSAAVPGTSGPTILEVAASYSFSNGGTAFATCSPIAPASPCSRIFIPRAN